MLIRQRKKNECAIACLAMATGKDYNFILENIGEKSQEALRNGEGAYTYDSLMFVHAHGFPECEWARGDEFKWDVPAIVNVPSLNIVGGGHSIYFDGESIYDPSTLKTYDLALAKDQVDNVIELRTEPREE